MIASASTDRVWLTLFPKFFRLALPLVTCPSEAPRALLSVCRAATATSGVVGAEPPPPATLSIN